MYAYNLLFLFPCTYLHTHIFQELYAEEVYILIYVSCRRKLLMKLLRTSCFSGRKYFDCVLPSRVKGMNAPC